MSVCPFCKAQVTGAASTAPCPRCGKLAADHPSIAAVSGRTLNTDFDDDDHGELALEATGTAGASGRMHAGMPYDGGKGVTLDDDLFGDEGHAGPLELDVPDLPRAPAAPAPPVAPSSSKMPAAPKTAGSDPRLASPAAPSASPASATSPAPAAPESGPHAAPPAAGPPPPPSAIDQAAVRIANHPPPPEKIWQAPRYALTVLYRQFELRQDLESLRRRRSPDVGLYERALRTHDPRMFRTGLAITAVAVFVALVLFFMPVIKRFAFAPD